MRYFGSLLAVAGHALGAALLISTAWAQPPTELFYADWTVVPGSVYWKSDAAERVFFTADGGRIYNLTVGPDGLIYFSDSNDRHVKRWTGEEIQTVYTHSTYLRDIGFDPDGRLYFSESSGAGGDGRIFQITDSGAISLWHTVSLNDVDGFWAGHFAFAPDGMLHLSTGNRSNGKVYQVGEGGQTTTIHSETGVIAGIDFDADGNLYYADWFTRIYRLDQGGPTVVRDAPGRRISDVCALKRSVSIGPSRGRVNSVTFHPANNDIVYAGMSSGGVYRSADAGQTWFWRGKGLTNPRIGEMVVYPPNSNVVLAATPSGVFRSANQGVSWTQTLTTPTPSPPPNIGNHLRYLHRSPIRYLPSTGAIYAAPFLAGVFESNDGGLTWNQIYGAGETNPLDRIVTAIDVSALNGGRIYLATPRGLMEKGVADPTWTQTGSEISPAEPIAVRVAQSNPSRVYVLAQDLDNWPSASDLWHRDGAGLFQQTFSNPPWLSWFGMMSLAVNPVNQDDIFVGSIHLYRRTTLGGPISELGSVFGSDVVGADHHGLTFNAAGTRFYSGHDHGLYFHDSVNNLDVAREVGLVNTQLYDLEVGPAGTLYIGTQDTGAYRKAPVGDWEDVPVGGTGDILDFAADPTDDQHIFVRVNDNIIRRSGDGGRNFADSNPVQYARFWPKQLAYYPGSNTVYTATMAQGVYKSTDDGVNFSPANNGIPNLVVRCLALAPGSDRLLYAGSYGDGVFRTEDGGQNWLPVSYPDDYSALSIAIAPNETKVYVGGREGVFISDDRGGTFTDSNTGLPAVKAVSEVIVDEACPCRVYAGLGAYGGEWLYGGGVYESVDSGATWRRLSSEAGAAMSVTSIRIDPIDPARLYIATYGSGVLALFRDISGGCPCP